MHMRVHMHGGCTFESCESTWIIEMRMRSLTMRQSKSVRLGRPKAGSDQPERSRRGREGQMNSGKAMRSRLQWKARLGRAGHGARCG